MSIINKLVKVIKGCTHDYVVHKWEGRESLLFNYNMYAIYKCTKCYKEKEVKWY